MDLSYLYVLYAFADPDFYDAAERSGADNGFPLTHCASPPG